MEDQVTFASEKTEGQYIHTSGRTYRQVGITLHENKLDFNQNELIWFCYISYHSHEINASATESGFTIKSHYRVMPNEQEFIKAIELFAVQLVTL